LLDGDVAVDLARAIAIAPGRTSMNGGAAMTPILTRDNWLERFAAHLLGLRPQLTPLEAAEAAVEMYEEACDSEPVLAATIYANDLADL
jgi:hypothetical protein